jgi:hypothetical protein
MSLRGVCALHALALVLGASSAGAQQPSTESVLDEADVKVERVVVTLTGAEREVRGRLLRLDAQTLTIEIDNNDGDGLPARKKVDLPLTRVLQVDVVKRDSLIDGAILGAVFVAACARWWCAQGADRPAEIPRDVWIGAGVGALVGAGIDAALFRRTTIYRAGGSSPPLMPGASVSFRLRF